MSDRWPSFSKEQIAALITEVKDYQISHGSLLKLVGYEAPHTVPARPIGAAIFPTPFPQRLFQQACELAPIFNRLYVAIAEDEEWLSRVLKDLIENDPLIGTLWDIYQTSKRDGYPQNHVMGVFRSDYMLHVRSGEPMSRATLKQVEFNAYSCAGGTHGNIIADMHRHLALKGAYGPGFSARLPSMPRNQTIQNIADALAGADETYRSTTMTQQSTCVLFVVQPCNINIADERPIEYAIWREDPLVSSYRVVFGPEIMSCCRIGDEGELLFTSPTMPEAAETEVSVVYMRAGYDIDEYDETGQAARLLIERSRAIKCPSIACHLATLKKVQQELTVPGALSRFLGAEDARKVEAVSMPLHPLDDSTEGLHARRLAMDVRTAVNYVLKPSLEGGGHNIYREAIPGFIERLPQGQLKEYILMEMITPPEIKNTLISWTGRHDGPVISELGVFGICLWSKTQGNNVANTCSGKDVVFHTGGTASSVHTAWSFKTKASNVDEMSVVKGYGCFDSPLLIDAEMVTTSV
ncbi:hypothetical protein BDV97DRAFT_296686 [Delphinella strobiligena]|nr:hypothetical protein BDV97DRAFT_296686 [Delphinella strobiligena]